MADYIRPTPQNPVTGAMARGLRSLQELASQYQVLPQVPLLGGTSVDELLSLPGAASLMEDISYHGPRALIKGGNAATGGIGTFRLDPRVTDVADVALNAAPVAALATKGAVRGARALEDATVGALQRGRIRAAAAKVPDDAAYAPLRERMEASGNIAYVVKPKGGNWAQRDVEATMIDPLKRYDLPDLFPELGGPPPNSVANESLNRWLDTKLTRYIKNEMGTPEDPVRALAERGVLHFQPREATARAAAHRNVARGVAERSSSPTDFRPDIVGESRLARGWEDAADSAILPGTYRDFVSEYAEPERLQNALRGVGGEYAVNNPDVVAYTLNRGRGAPDLGFDHLVDELKNAMAPDSILPANLRLTPDKLNKVTVPQAVELVDKINKWRSAEAAKAEKLGMMDNLKATPRAVDEGLQLSFVEKPGAVWVDIPETVTDEGKKLCTTIGKQGGWCTQQEWAATSYGSGENRLVAMLDADGRPHVQAKITSRPPPTWDDITARVGPDEATRLWNEFDAAGGYEADDASRAFDDFVARKGFLPPPDITELKPVANSFRSDRAQEYGQRDPNYFRQIENAVLKFLNEGQWGRVADLDHYGIVRIAPDSDLGARLQAAGVQYPEFVSQRQLTELLDKHGRTDLPPYAQTGDPEGFAQGGLVGLEQKYAGGGAVKTGLVKTFNSLRSLLEREAPEQAAPVREALVETARTGREHSVIGLAQEGGKSAVSRGTESSVLPNKFDLKAALRDPGRGPILDFHTHPGKGYSFFETAPSRQDFSFYSEQYPQSRELRSLIAVPPERAAGRRTSYNLFVTDKPNTVLDPRALDAARFELQRAGSKGAFRSLVDDPLFREYFEYGGDLGELLEDASSLMLQRYRAQQGAGRHELQLGGKQLTPNFESTDTEMFRRMEGPATEVLRSKKFAEGGAVEFDPDKIDRMAADILSQQPVEVGDKPAIFKSADEILARQGRLQEGPLSLGVVRSPRGADARLGLGVAPGLEPFADVDPIRRELTQYGVQYNQPLSGGGINAQFAVEPKSGAKMLAGAYRKQIGKDSELSARGAYVTGAGKPNYNVGVQYSKRFAEGGAVEFDPDKIEAMAAQLSEELYA